MPLKAKNQIMQAPKNRLLKASIQTILIRGLCMAINTFILLLMARALRIIDFADFSFGYGMAMLASQVLMLGSKNLIVVQIAPYFTRRLRLLNALRLRNWFLLRSLGITLFFALLYFASEYASHGALYKPSIGFLTFLSAIPLIIINMQQNTWVAVKKVPLANLSQLLSALLWLACFFVTRDLPHTASEICLTRLWSLIASAAICLMITQPFSLFQRLAWRKIRKPSLYKMLVFTMLGSVFIINSKVDLLVLKAVTSHEQLAIYAVASQWATLFSFLLSAINMNLLADTSQTFQQGNRDALEHLISKGASIAMTLCLPFAIALLIFGKALFAYYGPEYTTAYLVCLVLVLGQLLNIYFGSVGLLLSVSKHENVTLKAQTSAIVINALLSAYLGYHYGAIGVAFGVSIAMAFWNVALYLYTRRKLHIDTSVFQFIKRLYHERT